MTGSDPRGGRSTGLPEEIPLSEFAPLTSPMAADLELGDPEASPVPPAPGAPPRAETSGAPGAGEHLGQMVEPLGSQAAEPAQGSSSTVTVDVAPAFRAPVGVPASEDGDAVDVEPGSDLSGEPDPGWYRHDNGRWILGDPGKQGEIVASPALLRLAGPPPADTELDGCSVGRIVYRAGSLRGFSHQETGKPRQDAFAAVTSPTGNWFVACVADGVSDARGSHLAARLAVKVVAKTLVSALDPQPIPADADRWADVVQRLPWLYALEGANAVIAARARELLESMYRSKNDGPALAALPDPLPFPHARAVMSTTAVALVLSTQPDLEGTHSFAVCVVAGDSAAFCLREGRWTPVLASKDPASDIARNDVSALPTHGVPCVRYGCLAPGEAVVLMSDGLSDPLGSGSGIVGRFLATQWQSPPDLLEFGQHLGFYRRTYTDDRTGVVAWAEGRR
jgi:hypothetical protein